MPLKNISLDSATITAAVHELKTPLLAMKLTLELLFDPKGDAVTDVQRAHLEELAKSTEQTLAMVQDILAMARLGEQDRAQSRERVVLSTLFDALQEGLQPMITQKRLTIIREKEATWPALVTNAESFRAVLQNLFSNAVKYTPERGRITFALRRAREKEVPTGGKRAWCIVTIADTGMGVPKEEQKNIFGRFFRASNVKAKDPYGTGLGLFLTKALVERLGGRIWFTSREGKGTTFSIALPYVF